MINGNSDTYIGKKNGLDHNAYLSPLAVIALSFGYAVGWGAFVLPGAVFLPDFASLAESIRAEARPGDMILTVGAGDVYKVGEMLAEPGTGPAKL